MSGRSDFAAQGGHTVCIHEDWDDIKNIVKDTHKRLFVDNGVDSFQTMFKTGTARMDAQDKQITALRELIQKHEERPQKLLGMAAIVVPLIIAVGGTVYTIACWVIDHFQWRTP